MEVTGRLRDQVLGLADFIDGRHHGKHQPQRMRRGHPQRRPHLVQQQVRPTEQLKAQATHAKGRIRLGRLRQGGQRFVGADVERAQDDRTVAHRGHHLLQHRHLLVLVGQPLSAEKQELTAEQADAIRTRGGRAPGIIGIGGVAADLHPATIAGRRRLGIGRQWRWPGDVRDVLRGWIDDDDASITIEQHGLTVLDRVHQTTDADDRG